LAARLADDRIDRIYSSDLQRAMETARTIAQPHGLEVVADPRLREFAFGAWEGLTWGEIVAERPHLHEAGWKKPHLYAPEGGETYDAVWTRVRSFYRELATQPLERVVVVTHAGVVHALLDVLEVPLDAGATIAVASITRVKIEGERVRVLPA